MKLLHSLDSVAERKTPYQVFRLRIGLDIFEAQVPLARSSEFQQRVGGLKAPTKEQVLELVGAFGGKERPAGRAEER